jgi:hypothetical protein
MEPEAFRDVADVESAAKIILAAGFTWPFIEQRLRRPKELLGNDPAPRRGESVI